ncbi:hypothetical protein ACFQ7Z_03475 [Streptomyces virginiae]|uniref:hypothetical protein n=1 Tax=Streptomyces virginiae TaxID=1961 RepID=UPI003693CB8C
MRGTVSGPEELARLVATVADAAELTVRGATARAELHAAAGRAAAAADAPRGTDVRADLAAVRAGCRRAAVAVGQRVVVTF